MPPASLSDKELRSWARAHLVYEGRMLAFTAGSLRDREGAPPDPASNVLLESFVMHVRCLHDFLWKDRRSGRRYALDAHASDFCAPGIWTATRGETPQALAEVLCSEQDRVAREAVHLTYHRLWSYPGSSRWKFGQVFAELERGLVAFSRSALPTRLDAETRRALGDLWSFDAAAGTESVATGEVFFPMRVPFDGFVIGS